MGGCYVPGCDEKSEEVGEGGRLIFEVPPGQAQKWKSLLPKGPRPFNPGTDGICIKHFEEKFILKEETVVIAGDRQTFSLDPWELSSDALPTIFEGVIAPAAEEILHDNEDAKPGKNQDVVDNLHRNGTSSKRKIESLEKPGPASKKIYASVKEKYWKASRFCCRSWN